MGQNGQPMSPTGDERGAMQIGPTLQDARRRLGLDVREVEERTKIRARYIRALENEDWESLPAPAYVRGFLRTYGALLGLDGDLLADEFRRSAGGADAVPGGPPPGEPVLRDTGRRARGGPSRRAWIGILAISLIALLIVIGLLSGGEGGDGGTRGAEERREARQEQRTLRRERQERRERRQERRRAKQQRPERVTLDLETISPVELCVVAGADTVLIDRQVLLEGAEESFPEERRFRIDLIGGGELRIDTGAERQRVAADEPTSIEADPRGIRKVDFRGPGCP